MQAVTWCVSVMQGQAASNNCTATEQHAASCCWEAAGSAHHPAHAGGGRCRIPACCAGFQSNTAGRRRC